MSRRPPDYRSIFISDVHLGSKGAQADALCEFLKTHSCEKLYLVGDIIDAWRMKKKWYWPQSHTNVIRRVLTAAKRDTEVIYIIGNHDEFLRAFNRFQISFGRVKIRNTCVHEGEDGKTYFVCHGDIFDGLMRPNRRWIMALGDTLYNMLLSVNVNLNAARRVLGLPYWSLSKALKTRTKRAMNFVANYEQTVADFCRRKGYDGAICGHIHVAEIRDIDGITYMNDGDWVESCTALVEHHDGRWEILEHKPAAVSVPKPVKIKVLEAAE